MGADGVILILAITFGVIFAGLAIALMWVQRLAKQKTGALIAEFPQHEWVKSVNFFGLQSQGVTQMRGNGTLILLQDRLVFNLWIPDKRLEIPLSAITEISTPLAFLGKTKGRRLLRIDFRTADGKPDAAAWFVRDLEPMIDSIEAKRAA